MRGEIKRCKRCMAPMLADKGDTHRMCTGGPEGPWMDSPNNLGVTGREGEHLTTRQVMVLMHDETYKRVGDTTTDDGWWVSTVWAALPDLLDGPFETMVFDPDGETQGCWRTTTLRDAEMMHEVIVAVMQDATQRTAYFADQEARLEAVTAAIEEARGAPEGDDSQGG